MMINDKLRYSLAMFLVVLFCWSGCRQQDSTPAAPQTVDGQSASPATTSSQTVANTNQQATPIAPSQTSATTTTQTTATTPSKTPTTSRGALQKVELISRYFGREFKVTLVEPQKVARVNEILDRNGFFGLDEEYRNQSVRDGFWYTIRAIGVDGSIKSVTVQNHTQPTFAAIQRELFETGWTMPEQWHQID